MQSIQTSHTFPLSGVKPLEGLMRYRAFCLEQVKKGLADGVQRRKISPVSGERLEFFGKIDGLEYLICPSSKSLFLADVPPSETWKSILETVSRFRNSPETFHTGISKSRLENVFQPKLEWIHNTVRLQGIKRPKVMEVMTPPSPFSELLAASQAFGEVLQVSEMELTGEKNLGYSAQIAVLLESLDHVTDPSCLLKNVSRSLIKGGMLFVTALVSSGFDMTLLGPKNYYLYPPDRANCFSLEGLTGLLTATGFELLEVSTPGILDLEIVKAHLQQKVTISLSPFEQQIMNADENRAAAFQAFLQQSHLSSFARIVAKK